MSDFAVIPAIELRGGLALRYESVGVGTRANRVDPIALAKEYVKAGAPMVHVYNLDGPFIVSGVEHSGSVLAGAERNLTVVGEMSQSINVPIQFSGGVRDIESFKVVTQMGVSRAAFGSAAMRDPGLVKQAIALKPDAVVVFLDVKDSRPVSQDWVRGAKATVADIAAAVREAGVTRFIYQDIDAEAAGAGPRAGEVAGVGALGVEVILSGGVQTLDHVRMAGTIRGATGVIVGKPLAMRSFSYAQALEAAKSGVAARK
jgi:phosphoribosylformimino-5-aminoimidazole carboxamide ribotide isomerase